MEENKIDIGVTLNKLLEERNKLATELAKTEGKIELIYSLLQPPQQSELSSEEIS